MNGSNQLANLIDELAAHWTEAALDILHAAGMQPVSVETELDVWRALAAALRAELRWQRAFRSSTVVSVTALMEQVLRRATLIVLRQHDSRSIPYVLVVRIRDLAADRRPSVAAREVYKDIIRQAETRPAFKVPSRSDFTPRLRPSAVGG